MQLRNFITDSTRTEEKDHSSHGVSSLSSKIKRVVQPEYPSLLTSTVVKSTANTSPAAFPSRSVAQTLLKAPKEQDQLLPNPQQDGIHVGEEQVSLSTHNDGSQTNIRPQESHFDLDERIGDMQTSHLPNTELPVVSSTEWNMLDEGLQLYIFDNLRSQHKHAEVVARMLGLGNAELRDLLILHNCRAIHPLHPDQLWQYCVSLSGGNTSFIDPQILDQHMTYFVFAESLETASIHQRQLAKSFLSQRDIAGSWVDAILGGECGIWNRPERLSVLSVHSGFGSDGAYSCLTSPDDLWWHTVLSDMRIHKSHDLGRLAHHIRSPYFPVGMRDDLLSKAAKELSSFESWLVYARYNPELSEIQAPSNRAPSIGALNPPRIQLQPVLQFLRSLVNEYEHWFDLNQESMRHHHILSLCMYTITRFLAQMQLSKKEVDSTPFTRKEKLRMLNAANAQCLSKLLTDIEVRIPHSSVPTFQLRSSSPASVESSTLVDNEAMQTNMGKDDELESIPTSPIKPSHQSDGLNMNAKLRRQHCTTDTAFMHFGIPPPRNNGRSDTQPTKATQSMPELAPCRSNPLASRVQPGLVEVAGLLQGCHRTPSVDSYITARDLDEDGVMVTPAQRSSQMGRKSPSPPPWSPISDIEISSKSLKPAATVPIQQEDNRTSLLFQIGLILSRSTPWLSAKTMCKTPLASSNSQPLRSPDIKTLEPERCASFDTREPVALPDECHLVRIVPSPAKPPGASIPNVFAPSREEQTVQLEPSAPSNGTKRPVAPNTLPCDAEPPARPLPESQNRVSLPLPYSTPCKAPNILNFSSESDVRAMPSNRRSIQAGSSPSKTMPIEKTVKRPEDQRRSVWSRPIPKLLEKLLPREDVETPKPPRKDKGQKRGAYMTKKRRAEAPAIEAEAGTAKRVNTGVDQAASPPQ